MKRILKRFKYNRAEIFRHYQMRRLKNKTNVQLFYYTQEIAYYTKNLFDKFNRQITRQITRQIIKTRPVINILDQFFYKITHLMSGYLSISC
jgi:hypothetical protein